MLIQVYTQISFTPSLTPACSFGVIADRRMKPTETFGGRFPIKAKKDSRLRDRMCEFQTWPLRAWEMENGLAAISEIRTPDPAFPHSFRDEFVKC